MKNHLSSTPPEEGWILLKVQLIFWKNLEKPFIIHPTWREVDFLESSVDFFDTKYYSILILNPPVGLTLILILIANSLIWWPTICDQNFSSIKFQVFVYE